MEAISSHHPSAGPSYSRVCRTEFHYNCKEHSGLASPVLSNHNSDTEDEPCRKQRAVQFQQCPRPARVEPACKKSRCPTPPVNNIVLDDSEEEDDDEAEDDDNAHEKELDSIHADRFRRSDSESDDESDVFYCE